MSALEMFWAGGALCGWVSLVWQIAGEVKRQREIRRKWLFRNRPENRAFLEKYGRKE